jgi:hypothetical protein
MNLKGLRRENLAPYIQGTVKWRIPVNTNDLWVTENLTKFLTRRNTINALRMHVLHKGSRVLQMATATLDVFVVSFQIPCTDPFNPDLTTLTILWHACNVRSYWLYNFLSSPLTEYKYNHDKVIKATSLNPYICNSALHSQRYWRSWSFEYHTLMYDWWQLHC